MWNLFKKAKPVEYPAIIFPNKGDVLVWSDITNTSVWYVKDSLTDKSKFTIEEITNPKMVLILEVANDKIIIDYQDGTKSELSLHYWSDFNFYSSKEDKSTLLNSIIEYKKVTVIPGKEASLKRAKDELNLFKNLLNDIEHETCIQ